jgi:hypothetical protein
MDTAAIGVAQQEDEEQGVDKEHIFYRVVFFLAALTRFLCRRVLGADDAPFGPVMGPRGEAGAPTGAGASSRASTTEAASASETPSRWARAVRDRAGASPRARSASSSAGKRTWSHGLALLWPIPNRRPWTTWRLLVITDSVDLARHRSSSHKPVNSPANYRRSVCR